MRTVTLATLLGLTLWTGAVQAQVAFTVVDYGLACDISADGSVVVGNTEGAYETFRWTAETGLVNLGRGTVAALGVGAGSPNVSSDGTKVSATITSDDGTFATAGLWTLGSGWQTAAPPAPPDGGIMDQSLADAWGLSGDGQTLVGLYWRPGYTDGAAHPQAWTAATGMVALGTIGKSGRANAANYDGSVIVGWVDSPTGAWWPTVWVRGVMTVLDQPDGGACMGEAVTPDGRTIVGMTMKRPYNPFRFGEAAVWRWNEGTSTWNQEIIGSLPGTGAPWGLAIAEDVSADGSMIVGYNRYSDPSTGRGFIWTRAMGMVAAEDFLASHGVTLDPNFKIDELTAITPDGKRIVGIGYSLVPPTAYQWFMIDILPPCVLAGDINGDGLINGNDIAGFVRAKLGQPAASGETPGCADFGGTLEEDVNSFVAKLLAQ